MLLSDKNTKECVCTKIKDKDKRLGHTHDFFYFYLVGGGFDLVQSLFLIGQ